MDTQITLEKAKELILETKGRLFGVTFVKKDGSNRNMVARLGVRKGVKGNDMREQDKKFGVIRAYDFNADRSKTNQGGFRKITLNAIKRLKIKGSTYIVGVNNG